MNDADDFAVRLARRLGLDPESMLRQIKELCEEDLISESLMRESVEEDHRAILEAARQFEVIDAGEPPIFKRTLRGPDDAVALEFRIYAHQHRAEEILNPYRRLRAPSRHRPPGCGTDGATRAESRLRDYSVVMVPVGVERDWYDLQIERTGQCFHRGEVRT